MALLSCMTRSLRIPVGLILVVLLAGVGCPGGGAPSYLVDITTDVVYAVGYVDGKTNPASWALKELLADVYEPRNDDALRPALILVHGGNFTEGSKEKPEIVEYANFFARRGYVVFAINYRLAADNPPAPAGWGDFGLTAAAHAAMVDVKAAVRFVRAHAAFYRVDPQRIALLGESAGAIAGVTAAVTASGDFAADSETLGIPEQNFPNTSSRVAAYIHFWGNADHVLVYLDRRDPPIMIVHGTEDDRLGTRFESSERFNRVLDLLNMPHEFYQAEGFGHGAWDYRLRGKNLKTLVLEFLETYMPEPD